VLQRLNQTDIDAKERDRLFTHLIYCLQSSPHPFTASKVQSLLPLAEQNFGDRLSELRIIQEEITLDVQTENDFKKKGQLFNHLLRMMSSFLEIELVSNTLDNYYDQLMT
jgi:hypothetical protein